MSDDATTLIAAVAERLRLDPASTETMVTAVALELLAAGDAGVAEGLSRGSVVLALVTRIARDHGGYVPADPPRPRSEDDHQGRQRQQQSQQQQRNDDLDRSYGAPSGGAEGRYLGVTPGSGGGKND